MDERTLNDLLECSVCLERLTVESKVLPCQHTFCRKCLEVIVLSRQELRCPECRVLVDIKIDELPPNVLLMRILEGMKNATQNQNNITKSPRTTANSNINSIVTGLNNFEINETSKLITNDQPPIRASNEQNASNRRIVPHVFALHDFISKKTGDLNFKKGDIILLKRKLDVNWFVGELNGREGAIPINYVQIIVPLPVPQCMALYDFKMGPNEEEGCLTFKKGILINVLRRVDQNWAEGCIGSCIGIFPIAFVEMNALAKQLLENSGNPTYLPARLLPQIPFDNNSSDSSSTVTTSPNSTCSSNTSSNSVPSSPTSNSNSPQHSSAIMQRDTKEKRHSLNVLSANTNLSIVQSNRHSAEILSVPEPVEQSNICSTTTTNSGDDQIIANNVRTHESPSQQTSRANVLKTNIHHNVPNLPWAYVSLYPYKPRKSDELELKKGCVYFVTERCLDGWYKGKNWADKSGVFPGNYVTPLRNRDQQQLIHQRKSTHNTPHSQQIITSPPQPLNTHDNLNTAAHLMPPPELPPRSNTVASSSVWTKPLGHHVEAFLNKKFSNNSTRTGNADNKTPSIPNNVAPPKNHINCTNALSKDTQSSQTNAQQSVTKDKDKKEQSSSSAVSLMKRLTNMKRSKSPPSTNQISYLMDNPVFEDTATSPLMPTVKHNSSMSHPVHVRSGSCPSQLLQSLPIDIGGASTSSADSHVVFGSQRIKGHKERSSLQGLRQQMDTNRIRNHTDGTTNLMGNCAAASNLINKTNPINSQHKPTQSQQINTSGISNQLVHHRKSQSLDANTISSQITNSSLSGVGVGASCGKSHGIHPRESSSRFRCIVSYPPNSDVELELNVGDIVFVHRKQKNGWYKGTHSRTNKTGLFPASFVEPDI